MNDKILIKQPKNIFYEKNISFQIIPRLHNNDINVFKEFYSNMRNCSIRNSDHHGSDIYDVFWVYDEKNNSIIINEKIDCVVNDIFNQITIIAIWLYNKGYNIKGSFYWRTDNVIEYISLNNKKINHKIFVDDIGIENFVTKNQNINTIGTKIINDAKNKINKQKKSTNITPIVINTNNKESEEQIIINSIQDRLRFVENKVQSLAINNKYFWEICTFFGIFTVGSLIMYTVSNYDHNNFNSFNNIFHYSYYDKPLYGFII